MDYQKWILENLITKYEKSKAFISGEFTKKIAIDVPKEAMLQERLENLDEKNSFLAVLRDLKANGLIQYSWEKYEKGNLVEKIWLVPELQSIENCYRILKKVPAKEKARTLMAMIQRYRQEMDEDTAVYQFLNEMLKELSTRQKIPRFFSEDQKLNEDILKCLHYMEKNQDEQMERVLSSKLYEDSKHLEKTVKAKLLSVLRHIKKKETEEYVEDEELLREKGITRWPEILEFTGNITAALEDGTAIDFSTQKFGAYINSDTVKHVKNVAMDNIQRIIFIENKANYIWYVSHRKAEYELVIFHGGCYSPIKGRWFKKVYAGSKEQSHIVKYLHWSDIDVGGFRIFTRLRKNIVPELEPYQMDRKTLETFKKSAIKINDSSYRKILETMRGDPDYKFFIDVIQEMLLSDMRLEQENIIAL